MHQQVSRAVSQSMPRWYEWLIVLAIALSAMAYFAVPPLVKRLVEGAGGAVATVATGAAQYVQAQYEVTCVSIEHDPQLRASLGTPIRCAPCEQVTWTQGSHPQRLHGAFDVEGPLGTGKAYVEFGTIENDFRAMSIVVELDDKCVLVPFP